MKNVVIPTPFNRRVVKLYWKKVRPFVFCLLPLFLYSIVSEAQSSLYTLTFKNHPFGSALDSIEKQSGNTISFIYKNETIRGARPVTFSVNAVPLYGLLNKLFAGQPLSYEVKGSYITIVPIKTSLPNPKTNLPAMPGLDTILVSGRVFAAGIATPLSGANIKLVGSTTGTVTDEDGRFELYAPRTGSLLISYVGYEAVKASVENNLQVQLNRGNSKLDEVQVIAYGTTTQRISTGSVVTVRSRDIESQPVMNPLATLSGRVAGMSVTQTSGLPGGNFSINIRGRTSVNKNISNDPLFIIDGVPFANSSSIGSLGTAYPNGISPFNTINPASIESIEVLKDADATSIYGSRGANGVVLITTKKGKEGVTTLNANIYYGINHVTRSMPTMNTVQYIAMRKEAFINDGIIADPTNAYDLMSYDTTRYTDWKKYFIGNPAHTYDGNLTLSGGSKNTQFLIGGGYHRETTVFPGNLYDGRANAQFNINHKSTDNKLKLVFSGSFGGDRNNLNASDLTQAAFRLPPNTTSLVGANGKLVWDENGGPIDNPLSYLYQKYIAKTDNYLGNLQLSYELAKNLTLKNSFGYNAIYMDELSTYPIAAQNPIYSPVGYATFSTNKYKSLIVEPQLQYKRSLAFGKLDVLIGGTWQRNTTENMYINAAGYTSDLLLESLTGAGTIDYKSSSNTDYKYAAGFARINYNFENKYILNLTGRRDGSSRFGPQNRYANFGSIGAAWIFTEEGFITKNLPILSFGKLRGSYGTTGNDKIGDYNYLDTWTALPQTYLGQAGLGPTRLFNPDYQWEINKKFELGLELGFLRDRILLTTNWYYNRSSNQLIQYTLPSQTGGGSITANFPATVQNNGLEFLLNTSNLKSPDFEWLSNLNISIPNNKLVEFPEIEKSTYNATLIVGKPLNIITGLLVKGVNPKTGIYEYIAKDGSVTTTPTSADSRKGIVDINPKFFGGIGNNFRYRGFQLDVFLEFKKQIGENYLGNLARGAAYPGMIFNMPTEMLNRWTPENTNTTIEKFTASSSSEAYSAFRKLYQYGGSDLIYSDASYVRLKTISFSYTIPTYWSSKMALKSFRLYLNAQNLFTITSYNGGDPESQNIYRLPPLRTISFGLQASL